MGTAPRFLAGSAERRNAFLKTLKSGVVRSIGRSAGGRDIVAVEYGEKEPLDTKMDNLQSALASSLVPPDPTNIFPASFYGSKRRSRPVVVLQGAVHGSEFTGTVASLNLCRIIETGADLRGKTWPGCANWPFRRGFASSPGSTWTARRAVPGRITATCPARSPVSSPRASPVTARATNTPP